MKGPEEKEHHASSCSADWLVEQSRNAMANGDIYAAKSWLLTAKTLYPKAFPVQYEAFMMEKRTRKLSTCGKLFFEMIKIFPREELLWRELRKLVQSQEISINELDAETKFLREMSESLPLKYQRELLLHYADNQKDLIEKCRISLVVMRKFQGGTKQYGVKLIELLTQAEKDEHSSCLNIYRKMLVCDVLPVILKSPEVQIHSHAVKHKGSIVYLDESTFFHWLELCFEFYVGLSIHQSTLKYRNYGNASIEEPNMSAIDPEGDIGQNPWQSLHEVLILFATKCGWPNVLKIKDKLDPSRSRTIRNKWKALMNAKDVKSHLGLFYCILELYYFAAIEYCSKMVTIQTGQPDSGTLEYALLERVDQLGQECNIPQTVSKPPKKKRKLEDGAVSNSISEFQGSVEDVNIQFTSMLSGQNFDLSDVLQVAMDCKNFLMTNSLFEKEFARLEEKWSVHTWLWMDMFNTDSLLYQRKYNEIIELIRNKQMNESIKDISSPTLIAKQQTQLAVSLFCTGKRKDACEMAINSIHTISKIPHGRSYGKKTSLTDTNNDGRCLQAILCSEHEIVGYCIELLILCLKEKLPNVDIRPDKDRIGPLFETRKDDIIGHLIVLLQYNWPKGALLFEQLAKIITTLGGLKYKQFFSYVSNIDILEEFAYLNTVEKVQLELQETVQGETSRKTITRGVNRENKEDFKAAIDYQLSNIDESISNVILRFLKREKQSIISVS